MKHSHLNGTYGIIRFFGGEYIVVSRKLFDKIEPISLPHIRLKWNSQGYDDYFDYKSRKFIIPMRVWAEYCAKEE